MECFIITEKVLFQESKGRESLMNFLRIESNNNNNEIEL